MPNRAQREEDAWFSFLTLSFFVLIFFVYSYRLGFPNEMYYDEVYQVATAQKIFEGGSYSQTTHPPLGILLIGLSLKLLGDSTWAARAPSLLCGLGVLGFFYGLARLVTRSREVALLSVALLALDGLHFTQSRIGMLNTIMFCFELGSLFFLARFFLDPKRQRRLDMVWSGVLLGLSMNVRWVAFIVLPVHALFFVWGWKNKGFKNLSISQAILYFLVPGIVCYFLPFLIFPTLQGFSWKTIWLFHFDMWRYNTTLRAAHDYASEWWTWPTMSRPIWYFFQRQSDQPYPVSGIVCMGNPAILWGIPFLLLYSVWRWVKEKRLIWAFILIGYFSQWLPWAFVSRVKFFHYFHTATPFMCLAMALMLAELWDEDWLGRAVCVLIALLVVGMFIYWLPLLNATPISEEYFRHHLWFPNSWV